MDQFFNQTLGATQQMGESARGMPLLTQLNDVLTKGNPVDIKTTVEKILADPSYKDYWDTASSLGSRFIAPAASTLSQLPLHSLLPLFLLKGQSDLLPFMNKPIAT